jgi:hypothetical protein
MNSRIQTGSREVTCDPACMIGRGRTFTFHARPRPVCPAVTPSCCAVPAAEKWTQDKNYADSVAAQTCHSKEISTIFAPGAKIQTILSNQEKPPTTDFWGENDSETGCQNVCRIPDGRLADKDSSVTRAKYASALFCCQGYLRNMSLPNGTAAADRIIAPCAGRVDRLFANGDEIHKIRVRGSEAHGSFQISFSRRV